MEQVRYLGQSLIQAAVLPARAAYLVSEDSRAGFRRAVQEASTRWGGLTEPILPIACGGALPPWWRQVVQMAKVQALVNVDIAAGDARTVADLLALPVVELSYIDRSHPTNWTGHPAHFPLLVDSADGQVIVAAGPKQPLWAAVAAGDLSDEHADEMGAVLPVLRTLPDDQVARAQLRGDTLIAQTMSEFGVFHSNDLVGERPAIVVLTAGDSMQDCLYFWNLRALSPWGLQEWPMCLLPVEDLPHWLCIDRDLGRTLARPEGSSHDVVLTSASVPAERLHEAATTLGLQRSDGKITAGLRFPAEIRTPPYTYAVLGDVRQLFVFNRQYGRPVDVDVHLIRGQSCTLAFRSPVSFRSPHAHSLVRLSGGPLSRLPRRGSTARLVHNEAQWADDGIEFGVPGSKDYRLVIAIPGLDEATFAILDDAVASHKPSDKGKLGVALREAIDLTQLLNRGVYEAVIALMTPRSKELLRELKRAASGGTPDHGLAELAATWGGRAERRYRTAAQISAEIRGDAFEALELLCSLDWAERGLEVNCPRCGSRSFVGLAATSGWAACPGCNANAAYTAGSTSGTRSVAVQYRLNAFVDRAADQGVLPHLLVEAAISTRPGRVHLIPGLDLVLNDGSQREVDVYGISDARVFAGEVKTSAADFTTDQITRDVELSRALAVDLHVLACIQEIPGKTATTAQRLCDEAGLELVILDKSRLRPSEEIRLEHVAPSPHRSGATDALATEPRGVSRSRQNG